MPIAIPAFCAFLILYFNVIKRNRIYNKKDTGQTQDVSTKKWLKFIPIAIVVFAGVLIYFGYREPEVKFDTNTFQLNGEYGVTLPFTEIAEADTIVCSEIPKISIRTNGISLGKVHRGKFRTTEGEKIYLSIYSGVNPVIRIVRQDGSVYYINRKNATETRQIFEKFKIKNNIELEQKEKNFVFAD